MSGSRKRGRKSKKPELFRSKTYYFGTTLGTSFWRRYRDDEFEERGYGELWLTRNGLNFRRYFQMEPLIIPARSITDLGLGYGHAGKPSARMVLKIYWKKGEIELVSGFSSIKNVQELIQWKNLIEKVMVEKV